MDRGRMLVAGGMLVLAVGAGSLFAGGWSAPPPPLSPPPLVEAAQPGVITVHVAGWVRRPGLVAIPSGSRLAEAVAAAGGALSGAELSAVNLAQPLADGQQIVVPGPNSPPSADLPGEDGGVHINQAGAEEMQRLPGVGPVLAERIVAYRDQHGPFENVEDLLDVPGIGEAKLAGFRELVVVP
jgi:competence protein ComEA